MNATRSLSCGSQLRLKCGLRVLAILLIVQPSIEIIINEINQLLTKSNVLAFKTKAIIRDNTDAAKSFLAICCAGIPPFCPQPVGIWVKVNQKKCFLLDCIFSSQ